MAYPDHVRGICQRCGFEYARNKIRREWNGLLVCHGPGTNGCWEPRHPQDFARGVPDKQSVKDPAPEPEDYFLTTNEITADDL